MGVHIWKNIRTITIPYRTHIRIYPYDNHVKIQPLKCDELNIDHHQSKLSEQRNLQFNKGSSIQYGSIWTVFVKVCLANSFFHLVCSKIAQKHLPNVVPSQCSNLPLPELAEVPPPVPPKPDGLLPRSVSADVTLGFGFGCSGLPGLSLLTTELRIELGAADEKLA